ncbi:hypothetical protein BJY00DRAFT_313585 [Aspergillus carlsbadensis]|nr:hypothetical protein BJY00DRAFT_313585 [Aspergillus carlsbadensis]
MAPRPTLAQEYRYYRTGLDLCLFNSKGTTDLSANIGTPEAALADNQPWWGFTDLGRGGLLMQRGRVDQIFHFKTLILVEPRSNTAADRAAFKVAKVEDVERMWREGQLADQAGRARPREGEFVTGFWMERAPDMAGAGEACKVPVLRVELGRVTDVVEKYAFCLVFPVTGDGAAGWFTRQGFKVSSA